MSTIEQQTFNENPLENFYPTFRKDNTQILEEYISNSREYHKLVSDIKYTQSFEEVNQLLSRFNESNDAKLIESKFKQDIENYIVANEHQKRNLEGKATFTKMIYIEKSDKKSVQRIDISFNFRTGKIEITNGMKKDGSFKGMWDDFEEFE
ncbi:MAG: hypothetical protein ABIC82_00635 [bacterium]